MAHSASHRRDHHKQDEGASPLTYKGRTHWPRTKFHLEMHFDSHGLQGLIVRGLIDCPAGGFITSNINLTTMSVITTQAQAAARTSQPAQTAARGSSPQPAQTAARGSFTGTTTGITSVGDRGDPQLIQQAGGIEAAAAPPQAQLTALTELATQLQSDITSVLDGEDQQQVQQGLINQLQAIQRGIAALTTTNIITREVDSDIDFRGADMDVGAGETSLLADLEGAAKEQLTKIKLIRSLSEECTLSTYMGFDNQLQKALWDYATRKIYDTIAKCLGFTHRGIIRGITQGDGYSAWGKLVLFHNNKTASTMTGYLKQYQNEQQDTEDGPRFFSDYAQSLADIAELYHEASRRRKFISDELRRSRYLQLAERYSHIVETIETEDDQRMERDEELQTADEIETLIRRWEQRKLPELEKQMAVIRKRLRKEREHGHAHNTTDKQQICFNFQKGQCKFGDKCKYKHVLIKDINKDNNKGPRKPWTPDVGPCRHCGGDHWNSECPTKGNQQQEKPANQGKANITKAESSDSSSSSDEEVDWVSIYKKAKYKAKKQLKQRRNKGAANAAWYDMATKTKKTKKRSKR